MIKNDTSEDNINDVEMQKYDKFKVMDCMRQQSIIKHYSKYNDAKCIHCLSSFPTVLASYFPTFLPQGPSA